MDCSVTFTLPRTPTECRKVSTAVTTDLIRTLPTESALTLQRHATDKSTGQGTARETLSSGANRRHLIHEYSGSTETRLNTSVQCEPPPANSVWSSESKNMLVLPQGVRTQTMEAANTKLSLQHPMCNCFSLYFGKVCWKMLSRHYMRMEDRGQKYVNGTPASLISTCRNTFNKDNPDQQPEKKESPQTRWRGRGG